MRVSFAIATLALAGQVFIAEGRAQGSKELPTIAFSSFAPIQTSIFIADGDGSNARPLLAEPDLQDCNPSFSHDGAWIVFTSYRRGSADIYRVRPNGSGLERLTDDPAFDDQGVLSPDGKSLAFVSTRGSHANIWLLGMEGRKVKNLTPNSSGNFRPTWSPDGEWIAFSSDRDSTHPKMNFAILHSTEIYVMRKDGSEVRRITHDGGTDGSPSWSPDGSQIVFYSQATSAGYTKTMTASMLPLGVNGEDTQIVSVNFATGERRKLTSGPDAKWSPRWLSPERIAYVRGGSSGGIERIDGPAGARGEFWNPNWSPDGETMVFHREAGSQWPPVQSWPTSSRRFHLLRTGIFPSFSPSGDRLVSNSATAAILHNSILLMNADGSNRSVLFDDPKKSSLAPVWSPRGDLIAFGLGVFFQTLASALRPPTEAFGPEATSQLAIIRPDGTGLRVLASAGDHAGFPSWSPDQKRLVYVVSGKSEKGLRIIDLETERVAELTSGPQHDNFPSWSPLGDRIAFASNRGGDYELYTIRPDGTDLRQLTRSPGNDAHLAWSLDGKLIAFASARSGFKDEALLHPRNAQPDGEIFVMRADGSDVHQLTENPFEDATPAWVPPKAPTKKIRR